MITYVEKSDHLIYVSKVNKQVTFIYIAFKFFKAFSMYILILNIVVL